MILIIKNNTMGNHGLPTSSCILRRYMFVLILVFYACGLYAQKSIAQRLNDVLVAKDVKACKKLFLQITQEDIAQMADSTLFDYYYLAAWYAMENDQPEESYNYLVKAKELCETKLGIQNNIFAYFEIIKAIGENRERAGKDDDALLWYEEGLVKALPYLDANVEPLKTYIKELRDNAASIYEANGYFDMAHYLSGDKPLDYEGSFENACDLFNQAISLYKENKANEGIALLDKAKAIFKQCGTEGEEWMQPLYRGYLLCYTSIGDIKQIDKLLKTKKRVMFQGEGKSYFVSDVSEIIASFINIYHDMKSAAKYYEYLLENYDRSNSGDVKKVEEMGKHMNFFLRTYNQIDSLEQVRKAYVKKDYAWGVTSLQLANILIMIQRYEDSNKICEEIYPVSSQLSGGQDTLHWFVLMNLADYNIKRKNGPAAERYLKEQLRWLDAHGCASDDVKRGWAYNSLGVIYMNAGKYKECHKMQATAEKILLHSYSKESLEYGTLLHNKGRLAQLEGKYDEAKEQLTQAKNLQIKFSGKALELTEKYLEEVEHAIKVRL